MHTLTLAIVPPTVPDLEEAVDRVMRGEFATEFQNFDQRCSCWGRAALKAGFESFDSSERGRRKVGGPVESLPDQVLEERWRVAMRFAAARADSDQPDPQCDLCGGRGWNRRSRDPRQHFDWWQIGGRWKRPSSPFGTHVERHSGLIRELARDLAPAAIVTYDEGYFESDVVAGFSRSPSAPSAAEDQRAWRRTFARLTRKHGARVGVIVDGHS